MTEISFALFALTTSSSPTQTVYKFRRTMKITEFSLASMIFLSACASVTTEPDGTSRIIGLVDITIPAPETAKMDRVDIRSIGFFAFDTPYTTGLSLGVQRFSFASISEDIVLPRPLILGNLEDVYTE